MTDNRTTESPVPAWSNWAGWPWLLMGLTVLLRLLHLWNSSNNPTFWALSTDMQWYDDTARDLVQGRWDFPLFRAPGYPVLLAAVYSVIGHDLIAARVLNVILQVFTVWAVFRIGKSYFSPPVGVIAAGLFAVNGITIYFAGEILSSSAEMTCAVLALWATLRLTRQTDATALIVCGLAWGLAAVTRPNFLMVFPVVLIFVVLRTKPQWIRSGVIWCIAAVVPILPVTIANYVKSGELILIASQGGVNFWIGNNPQATGILANLPGYGNAWTLENVTEDVELHTGRKLSPGETSDYYYERAWRFLLSQPLPAVRFMIRKTALFFNRFEVSNNKNITYFSGLSPWLPALLNLNFGLLVPLGLLALGALCRRTAVGITAAAILVYAASVILFFVTARFRLPVIPWMSLLAGAGIWWLVNAFTRPLSFRRLWPALLLVPGAVVAYMNPWELAEAPHGWTRFVEGNAYMKLNQPDSARAAFHDAIKGFESVEIASLNMGILAYREHRFEEAKTWYLEVLRLNPSSVEGLNNLGTVYEALGDIDKAVAAYESAHAVRPLAPNPRHNLAGIRFRQGIEALKQTEDSLAVRRLLECIALEPSSGAHYNIALAYGRSGNSDAALQHLETALEMDPGMISARQLMEQIRQGTAVFP